MPSGRGIRTSQHTARGGCLGFDYSQCRILDIGQRRVVLEDKKHKKERFGHKERFVHLIKRFVHLTNVTNA